MYPFRSEYALRKEDVKAFIKETGPRQKRRFLANFIKSITVQPEKLIVAYLPPILPKNNHPETIGKNGRGLSAVELVVPRRYLEHYEQVNLRFILEF